MNGYLQRLASNARNPGGIHPLVGSLYSRPEPESLPPLMEEHIEVQPSPQARERVNAPLTESLMQETTAETTNRSVPAAQPRAIGNTVGEPLHSMLPVEPPLAGPPTPRASPAQPPKPRPGGSPKPLPAPPTEPLLLPPDEPRPAAIAQFAPRLGPAQPGLAPHSKPVKPRSHNDAHGSGEIQIHIGRIEVTAVPPPLPRPTAPPARKSINLGEYLKRGRGGSS
jgi:hypothetical protein